MIRIGVVLSIFVAAMGGWAVHAQAQRPPTVVWAVGDGADGSTEALALSATIQADSPDAFLYLGDVYPEGTRADFAERYRAVYGPLDPITWPTPGNHDWGNRVAGYYPYWRSRIGGKPWYRVRIGGWDVISLNSEARHDARSRQVRWLKRTLARSETTCRLAFWHRPRYNAGTNHRPETSVTPFWKALRGRARLVVNAHEHVMMRYRVRYGISQYISGAGGDTLYGARADRGVAFARAGIQGALRIVLRPGRAALQFRSIKGSVLDRSAVRCRRPR